MTELIINVVNVAGETDLNDRVRLWPPYHRADGGRVVSTAAVDVPLVDGYATVDVLPGPARVQVIAGGVMDTKPRPVMVPDAASVTLRALMEDNFEWEPEIVSQVTLAARRAEDAAVRAEDVADAFGSLEGVVDQVQAAEAAASSAEADRLVVEQAATSASWSGDRLTVLGATSPPLTGEPGPAGAAPYVGANGNWWVGDTDTGVRAQGEKGDSGDGAGDVLWSELNPVLDGKAAVSHNHTIAQVSDLQDELDGKAAAGHQHSWGDVTGKPAAYPPEVHTHTATQISDATATGRSVLTAASQAAARTAIGAGTSSLALGTTASTAKAGNYQPTAANISDATTVGRNVLKAADAAAARTAIGAGTSSLGLGSTSDTAAPGNHTHSQYAESSRVTALEGSQPIIVSSLPASPLPGRIYLVTG